ncbi:MAG: hypothetical protein ACUVT7_07735, partial [Thermoplasmata archaeon]
TMVGVLCAVLVMAAFSVPAAAVDRSSGEYWTYDMTMNLSGLSANGIVTYSFDKTDTIVVNGSSYDVNVMEIEGSVEASTSLFGSTVSVVAELEGHSYETREGLAVVMEDASLRVNTSMTLGTLHMYMDMETEIDTSYTPPLMSGFDPDSTGPGDSWTETVNMHMHSKTIENGTETDNSTNDETVVYSIALASSTQTIVTNAGTFETLRMTVANTDDHSYEVFWWSSEVNNYVKQESYEAGSDEPYVTLSLKEYGRSSAMNILLVGLIAGVALVVILVLVVVVMAMRRRPGQPVPYQPPPLPYQPPTLPPPNQ